MSYNRELAFRDALREAMSATVPDAIQPQGSPASDPAAGASSPKGVSVDRVASVSAVRDAGSETDDGNRVEHERQARLRRWQAVGERRT